MLALYLAALAFGGTLLAVSLLFGGDAEIDAGVDVDVDADVDADADADIQGNPDADSAGVGHVGTGLGDLADAWLPITSLRFWTFFLTFFGLTGASLAWSGAMTDSFGVAIIAVAIGYVSGAAIANTVKHLRTQVVDSSVTGADCVGTTATVVLAVSADKPGTVRASIKGRLVELVAETEEVDPLVRSTPALIYAVKDDGRVLVQRADSAAA